MKKRLLAFVLAVLTLLPCTAACSEKQENNVGETEKSETAAASSGIKPQSTLPKLNYNGEDIRIYYFGYEDSEMYDAVGELSGDVVTDEVYNRNLRTAEQLNVKFTWIKGASGWADYPEAVKKSVMAGDDQYDMIFMESSQCFRLSLEGYFKNLASAQYIDYEKPWWYTTFMNDACITPEQRYFVTGAFSLTTMLFASAMYFNKNIYENYFGDSGELYEKAAGGQWTYDELIRLCRAAYADLNGNGESDDEDLMGIYIHGQRTVNFTSMSTGLTYVSRGKDGLPVLDLYNDDVIKWVDKLYTLCFDRGVSREETEMSAFLKQKALFYMMELTNIKEIRDSDFAWGILPYPTLREGMDYKSAAGTVNGNSAVLPVTASPDKYDACCAVLEALSYEAYDKVVPAWYQIALKNKYSDTVRDSQMIDIIYNSIYSPFIMVIDKYLHLGSFFYTCVYQGKTDAGQYASYWQKNEAAYGSQWQDMINKYFDMVKINP